MFLCARQEECPVVLAACERKVRAEGEARSTAARLSEATAGYEAKRQAMNELYAAGVAMRKAQREYFKLRIQERLYAAKDAEDRFDRALRACHALANPNQRPLVYPV